MKKEVPTKNKKEIDVMSTAAKLSKSERKYLVEMDNYIVKLKKMEHASGEAACNEAKKALLRTGVVTRSGKAKKKIVSWE